ncbi:MAG: hypothetical protein Q9160_001718 [Pyrenula sp. 1 TL-2023]
MTRRKGNKSQQTRANLGLLRDQDPHDYAFFMDSLCIKRECQASFFDGVICHRIKHARPQFNAGNFKFLTDRVVQGYGSRCWSKKSRSYLIIGHPDEGQSVRDFEATRDEETRKQQKAALKRLEYENEDARRLIFQTINGLFKAVYEALVEGRLPRRPDDEQDESNSQGTSTPMDIDSNNSDEQPGDVSSSSSEYNELSNSAGILPPSPPPQTRYVQLIPGSNDDFNTRGPDGKLTTQATRLCVLKAQEIIHFLHTNSRPSDFSTAFTALDESLLNQDYLLDREPVPLASIAANANLVGRVTDPRTGSPITPFLEPNPFETISSRRVPALEPSTALPIGLSREPWLSDGDPGPFQHLAPRPNIPFPRSMRAWINVAPLGTGHRAFRTAAPDVPVPCERGDMQGFFESLLHRLPVEEGEVKGYVIGYGWCSAMRWVPNYENAKRAFWGEVFCRDVEFGVRCGVCAWRLTVLVVRDLMWGDGGGEGNGEGEGGRGGEGGDMYGA